MTKRISFFTLFCVLALAILAPVPAAAQTYISNTTLSTAITSTATTTVTVASATGITATNTLIFVDSEAMFVNQVSGTTLAVTRGYFGGRAQTHASGALTWFGPPQAFGWAFPGNFPSGSCTRSTLVYLPYINTDNGQIADCVGGVWVAATGSYGTFFRVPAPSSGGTAYTSLNTNGTTLAATTMYCSEIDLGASKLATGLGILNGTTVGTDKHLVALYDATGNLLANSATAGATTSGASTYQTFAFTSQYFLVGPAKYYGCMQTNGTTDTVRMLVTGVQDTYTTKGVTGQTFGTVPATITVPTTFTTAVGPYEEVY